MTSTAAAGSFRIAVFSGVGDSAPDLRLFAATPSEFGRFAPVDYPGWRRYTDEDFRTQALIDDLADEIAGWGRRVVLVGFSLGGRLGYAASASTWRVSAPSTPS